MPISRLIWQYGCACSNVNSCYVSLGINRVRTYPEPCVLTPDGGLRATSFKYRLLPLVPLCRAEPASKDPLDLRRTPMCASLGLFDCRIMKLIPSFFSLGTILPPDHHSDTAAVSLLRLLSTLPAKRDFFLLFVFSFDI